MLIQFDKTSTRAAYGATSDCSRLDLRDDGGDISRNRYSPGSEADAAFRERIAFRVFGFITLVLFFLTPLILAGIAVKFG